MNARQRRSALCTDAGLLADALGDTYLTGSDPVLPSSFAIGTAASIIATTLWRHRGGRRQLVSVDMRHAAIEFRSEHFSSLDGAAPADGWDLIAGTY